jgi:type II secretory pathway component PulJ
MRIRTKLLFQGQRGFSLVEALAGLLVAALISSGIAMATYQTLDVDTLINSRMAAIKQVENALNALSRDARMAQVVQTGSGSGFPLTLTWTEWDNTTHQVSYFISERKLKRRQVINSGPPSEAVAADYLSPELSGCGVDSGVPRVLTVFITATVGDARPVSEARTCRLITQSN